MPDTAAKKRARYQVNKEKVLASNRRWREENPEKAKACARRMQYEQPAQWVIRRVPVSAKQRGVKCTIGYDELAKLLEPMVCNVTGVALSFSPYDGNYATRHPWKPSFDRIDNSKGYVPGNVQLVCWAYNLAKGSWGADVPLVWAKSLLNKHESVLA
jgi:hypothetical protein